MRVHIQPISLTESEINVSNLLQFVANGRPLRLKYSALTASVCTFANLMIQLYPDYKS